MTWDLGYILKTSFLSGSVLKVVDGPWGGCEPNLVYFVSKPPGPGAVVISIIEFILTLSAWNGSSVFFPMVRTPSCLVRVQGVL